MTTDTKHWYLSKTLWVNASAAALVALETVSGLLQPHMSVDFYTTVAVVLPIINAVLRVITSEGLRA